MVLSLAEIGRAVADARWRGVAGDEVGVGRNIGIHCVLLVAVRHKGRRRLLAVVLGVGGGSGSGRRQMGQQTVQVV